MGQEGDEEILLQTNGAPKGYKRSLLGPGGIKTESTRPT